MASVRDIYTRAAHDAGTDIAIKHPATGEPVASLHIVGIDSAIFQRATRAQQRTILRLLEKNGRDSPAYLDGVRAAQDKTLAALVTGWTFDEPCTEENVLALFENAPSIRALVDESAGKPELFSVKPSGV